MALIVLTTLSWFMSTLHLGAADTVVALGIAIVKSTVVVLIFMHVIKERVTTAVVPVVAILFVALLAGLTAADVATRRTFPRAPLPFEPGSVPAEVGR
jgi:cytochrome c oxidase subunit 4